MQGCRQLPSGCEVEPAFKRVLARSVELVQDQERIVVEDEQFAGDEDSKLRIACEPHADISASFLFLGGNAGGLAHSPVFPAVLGLVTVDAVDQHRIVGGGTLEPVAVFSRHIGVPARVDQDILSIVVQVEGKLVGMAMARSQSSCLGMQIGALSLPVGVSPIGEKDQGVRRFFWLQTVVALDSLDTDFPRRVAGDGLFSLSAQQGILEQDCRPLHQVPLVDQVAVAGGGSVAVWHFHRSAVAGHFADPFLHSFRKGDPIAT